MLHIVKPEGKRRGKRLLFINPPVEQPYFKKATATEQRSGFLGRTHAYPLPIGLLRVAGQLLREGNEVLFLDCFSCQPRSHPSSLHRKSPSAEPDMQRTDATLIRWAHHGLKYNEIRRLLRNVTADEVYVGCTFTYYNESAHRTIALCREELPHARIRLGGIYPTLAPDAARQSMADEVFVGQYPGIEDESLNYDFLGCPPSFILVKGTSGCPHNCAYCAVHLLEGRHFSHRDPDEVFAEIARTHRRYGLTALGIWDSNLLTQYGNYFGVVLARIIRDGLTLKIRAEEGLDYRLVTEPIAETMKRAGFQYIWLALENRDEAFVREHLNRQNSLARLRQAVACLKAAGFRHEQIGLFVMIGLPGQSLENVIQNIRFVWNLECNVMLFPYTPIPGTALYNDRLSELRDLPLKALHPTLFPCVTEPNDADAYFELIKLNTLNSRELRQSDHLRECISDETLSKMLEG